MRFVRGTNKATYLSHLQCEEQGYGECHYTILEARFQYIAQSQYNGMSRVNASEKQCIIRYQMEYCMYF